MSTNNATSGQGDTRSGYEFDTAVKRRIDDAGRVLVPAKFRKALSVDAGSEVLLVLGRGVLEVHTIENSVRDAQALVRRHVPRGTSLVRELIEDRKHEAIRE